MIELVEPAEFMRRKAQEGLTLLDTRSPGEFAAGHVIGAKSLPLFSDEERAIVGTLYKQVSEREALLRGLDIVGPKMRGLIEEASRLSAAVFPLAPKPDLISLPEAAPHSEELVVEYEPAKPPRIGVYCWRGGSRSGSVAWLLETAGFAVTRLRGGYKAYRQYGRSYLDKTAFDFRVIDGPTGSGKTELLRKLGSLGAQILDLEAIAHHKGSAFGLTPGDTQPSSEAAENEIVAVLQSFDVSRPIWVENESRNVGQVFLPDAIVAGIDQGHRVEIIVSRADRLDHIVSQYGRYKRSVLADTFHHLRKRLGAEAAQRAIEAVDAGDLHAAAAIALQYYDKTYTHSSGRQAPKGKEVHETNLADFGELARRLHAKLSD